MDQAKLARMQNAVRIGKTYGKQEEKLDIAIIEARNYEWKC